MSSVIDIKRSLIILAFVLPCISVRGDVWLGVEPADIDLGAGHSSYYAIQGKVTFPNFRTRSDFFTDSGAGEPNETRTINYTYDNLNRIIFEDANDSSDAYGYLGSYTYDIVGNRLRHTVDCNSKTLVTDYTYDPNVNQLTKEVHDGPEYAFIWNDQRVYAYAGNGDGRITHYRIGNTDKDVGHIKAFFIGLPSKWSPWLFYAALILVPLAFLSPAAAGIYARMRKRPGGCKIRLSLYHRCVLVFLAYALLIGPFGFESLSEGATLYSQLATTDWASGDRTIEYEYDNNGSQTKKTTKETSSSTVLETTAYEYNLQNRMSRMIVSYEEDSNDVNEVTEYTYNDSGIRVKSYYYKTIDSGPKQNEKTKLFLIDAYNHTGYAQVLEQWSPSGSNPDITYTIGDDIITQKKSSGVRHFLYDGHGSTRQLIDNNENIINEYSYDAYGVMLGGNPKPGSPPATNLLYTGEHFDTNMQMYNLRARWYNQNNGRFNRMDTFAGNNSDPQSLHKYLYAYCNPINNIDPMGTYSLTDLKTTMYNIGQIMSRYTNAVWRGLQKAKSAVRLAKIRRFFWDNRTFNAIRKQYWKLYGPANKASLHHWLFPKSAKWIPQGLRNAGFNLLNMPKVINTSVGGLNQWMGFAIKWGGYRMVVARVTAWGIRFLVPIAGYGAWTTGEYVGNEIANLAIDLGDGATATPLDLSPVEIEKQQKDIEEKLEPIDVGEEM